jgi:hypothetical protein
VTLEVIVIAAVRITALEAIDLDWRRLTGQ